MTLPLHLFGGWLQLFYVLNWIGIIINLIGCYTTISTIAMGLSMEGVVLYLVLIVDQIIYLILTFNILRIVRIKEMNIPERIVRLLTWIAVFSLGFTILEIILSYLFFGPNSSEFIAEIGKNIGRAIVFWAIWSNYFMKSQRVSSYYGRGSSKLLKF